MGMSNDQSVIKQHQQFGLQKSRQMRNLSDSNSFTEDPEYIMQNQKDSKKHEEDVSAMQLFTSSMNNIKNSHISMNDAVTNSAHSDQCSSSSSLSSSHSDVRQNNGLAETPPFSSYYSVGNGSTRFPYYDPLDIGAIGGHKKVVISNSPQSSCGSKTSGSPQKSPVRGILKKRNVPSNSVSSTESIEPFRLSKSEGDLTRSPALSAASRPPSMLSDITFTRMPSAGELNPSRKSAFVSVKSKHNNIQKADGPIVAIHPKNGHLQTSEQTVQMQVTPRVIGKLPMKLNPVVQYTSINQHLAINEEIKTINSTSHQNAISSSPKQLYNSNISSQDKSTKSPKKHERNNRKGKDNPSSMRLESPPLPPAEVISNEATRIRTLLEEMSKETLYSIIIKKLDTKDPTIINAISKIFPATKFTSKAHCVRCHKDYNPTERGHCVLSHPERMVAKIGQDDMGADFVCGCCNVPFRLIKMDFYEESTNALLTGHCYSGLHTSDPGSVDYRLSGGAAKTCQEHGCVEFYV